MSTINMFSDSITVIIIAHRLSTLLACDRVIRIEKGALKEDGPPDIVLAKQVL